MATAKKEQFRGRYARLAEIAKALSHPARIAILQTLAKRNVCICGEIVEVMPLAQSTVSQHLKELRKAGLITGQIEGPRSCYCLNHRKLTELGRLMAGLMNELQPEHEQH